MKFQPDTLDGVNNITRYDVDNLRVNAELHTTSVLVPWVGQARDWDASRVEELTQAHFDAMLEFDPEVVIFGSGPKLKFVSPALYRGLSPFTRRKHVHCARIVQASQAPRAGPVRAPRGAWSVHSIIDGCA